MTVDILWRKIPIKPLELTLSKVLRCGQTFRWKNINNTWSFVINDRIILLKQDDECVHFSWILSENSKKKKLEETVEETYNFIHDYFNLGIKLEDLYVNWLESDRAFKKSIADSPFQKFTGIRILKQDPWETLISFICSSNNNVKRISKMCDNLCSEFGEYIGEFQGLKHYSFPTPKALSDSPDIEKRLRELGFGYRAKYIYQTACKFTNNEDFPSISLSSLNNLRKQDYEIAYEFLLQLTGVGPKVADCICLMALEKHNVVPIDTHVYQIAIRDYKFKGKKDLKTLNSIIYKDIKALFKNIFGDYAGWAQSVLFTSDLSDLNNGINQLQDVKTDAVSTRTEDTKRKLEIEIKAETTDLKKLKLSN